MAKKPYGRVEVLFVFRVKVHKEEGGIEPASNEPVKYIISLVFYTPEWLLVPVFLSVQASMTLSTAYSDDCFFNTVKSKRLPLKATSWTSFSPTTLSMELYIGNFSGQLTPRFKEDILFD